MNNWFTAISLTREILENKITIVGTLRRTKREIRSNFVSTKGKEIYSTKFGFH